MGQEEKPPVSTGVPSRLRVGYNYPGPSNQFGFWIGPHNRQDKWPPDYATQWKELPWKSTIQSNLATLQQNGIEVVRWFLMGNGWNYGPLPTKETKTHYFPAVRTEVLWHFDPPDRLDPLFVSHFQQLLELHKSANMKMIPSLVSFEFFETDKTENTGAGGRVEVATDWRKRNTFLFTVLGEFLRVSNDYRPWIEAWEVINEPAWDVRMITPTLMSRPHDPFVDQASMNEFIRLSLAWIEDRGFPSTVGHRFFSDLSDMPTGTRRQFHYYADNYPFADPTLGLPKASDTQGAFIGEFGSSVGEGFELNETPNKGHGGHPWSRELPKGEDKDAANTVYERLKVIKKLGYELALVWPDYNDGNIDSRDALKISPQKLQSIKRFHDSQ